MALVGFVALAGLVGLPTGLAEASRLRTDVALPGSGAWKPLTFRSVERHTHYASVVVEGRPAFRADSECAASALVVPVDTATLRETPILRWRWKVEQPLDIEDERSRDGDDFAARVYILFRFQPEKASFYERARRSVGEALYGQEIPGNALNYVWSSRIERGASWPNPFSEQARMLSLGPGTGPGWRHEQVDVVADYRAQFGADPPEPIGLAIMTDSDNSCARARALFAGFHFVARSVLGEEQDP